MSHTILLVLLPLVAIGCSKDWKQDEKTPNLDDTGDTGPEVDTADSGGDSGDSTADTDLGDSDSDLPDVDGDGDGYPYSKDCDDTDDTVYPGAPELCDGKDNDCDGETDDAEDVDGDGISDCSDYCPVYARPTATGDGRYADPMGTIQEAVDFAGASGCNEVRAFKGTFVENVDWHGYPVNAESMDGPGVTIIDGNAAGPVVSFRTAETEDARIYGFTITNGGGGKGGGFFVNVANPTIEGNLITGNHVDVVDTSNLGVGAGIWSYNASPVIVDNEIVDNDACWGGPENGCDGGAMAIRGGTPLVQGNLMQGNSAGDGGAIWLAYSDAMVVNNVIDGNLADDSDDTAGGQGGGINVQIGGTAGPWIEANIIQYNEAGMYGGGIVTYEDNASYADATIVNNTIVYNTVTGTDYGAGFLQWRRTTPTLMNNIIAYNDGVGVYSEDGIDATFTYNLVYGNDTDYGGDIAGSGVGNLSADPRFVSSTDLHLQSGSPAINAGNPAAEYNDADGTRGDLGGYGGPNGSWP